MSKDVSPPVVLLAPMAGFSSAAARSIARRFGADMCVTEMVSAKGLLYRNPHSNEFLRTMDGESEVIVQLFGSDPAAMSDAATLVFEKVGSRLYGIDINMGCPVHKVFRNGEGSALMGDPDRAQSIVSAVKKSSPVPVSVKIRSGLSADNINAVPFAKRLEDAGADWITVHPRTRDAYYAGKADWSIIRDVAQVVSIPIIGNGDITRAEDAQRMMDETGCRSVMIGRAAIGNPFIFAQIGAARKGERPAQPALEERIALMKEHLRLEILAKGERRGVLEMRAQFPKYLHGMPGATKMRNRLNTLDEAKAIEDALDAFQEKISGCARDAFVLN